MRADDIAFIFQEDGDDMFELDIRVTSLTEEEILLLTLLTAVPEPPPTVVVKC